MASWTWRGIRDARASGSRSSWTSVAPVTETVTAARTASRGATISWAQPVATSCSASTLRENAPTSAAAPWRSARLSSTSRAWG